MSGSRFTPEEVTLCAYIAMYDGYEFGGDKAVHYLAHRSLQSIKMRIRNIVAALDEDNVQRSANITPHKGASGNGLARRTDWHIISNLVNLPRSQFLTECRRILV